MSGMSGKDGEDGEFGEGVLQNFSTNIINKC